MIILDCIQGSPAWELAKCGVVSASAASEVIVPGKDPYIPPYYGQTPAAPSEVKRAPKQSEILGMMRGNAHVRGTDITSPTALAALVKAGFVKEVPPSTGAAPVIEPMKLSAQRDGYLNRKLSEWVTGSPASAFKGNVWTEHGLDCEAEALEAFRLITGEDARAVGFIYRDDTRLTGCSPDWLGADHTDEVKCPAAWTHVGWLRAGNIVPKVHVPQVQYQLWVTGMPRGFFISYAAALRDEPWRPGAAFPPLIVEVAPDARWQDAFDEHVPAFVREMLAARAELLEMGVRPAPALEAAA